MIAWIKVFVSPIELLYNSKQIFRNSIRYKLQHNGQVIYLEKVLNEYYGIAGYDHQDHQATKSIYIGVGENLFPTYLFKEIENNPVHIYTQAEIDADPSLATYLYTQSEIDFAHADFTVLVPVSLIYIEAELRAVIDYYINTKIYKIKTY